MKILLTIASILLIVVGGCGDDRIPVMPEYGEPVEFTAPPVLTFWQEPPYPRLAEQAGITGTVRVAVLIDTDGRVRKAQVAVHSGTESLNAAAIEAAYDNRYRPAHCFFVPVYIWWEYDLEFYVGPERGQTRGPLNEGPAAGSL